MKLVLKSLGLSGVLVCGYVGLILLMFHLGAFESLGLEALNAMSAPVDLPDVVYRYFWPVSLTWVWPFLWSLCGNILIYSLPIYIFLRARGGRLR